ncbi:H-NS histone family protein [Luteimonas fraxinea]|uniref:H-NS histone family protein n=1 Tax=Luteimonas fraxinea TaxID=2901869 RepID=UPI001E2B5DD3|nr:H-NS histone family protein [Luteimonas fraxinea]UHH09645.1 H-NS histone family protein [Luteimonas fraxinea]
MKFDLTSFDVPELGALITAARKHKTALCRCRRRPIVIVRQELTAIAAEHGYTIQALFGDEASEPSARKPRRRKAGKVAVKYRDPDNKRNTWTGRGSQPRWLRDEVKRGLSASDFLLPCLAKPTANSKAIGQRSVFKAG